LADRVDRKTPAVGIVLAAGEGRRMGRPKALVRDPDGTSWLLRAVHALGQGGCSPVIVVLGAKADLARPLLDGHDQDVLVVEATAWSTGMAASLRVGLEAAASTSADAAVVTLVDLLDVGADVVQRLVAAVGDEPRSLGRAAYKGIPGHPVVLGRQHWSGVAADAAGDRGARDYLAAHDALLVECGDLARGVDVDAPPDGVRDGPMG
jgi:CTP:molybdopterin cytidylyltransferase MocA